MSPPGKRPSVYEGYLNKAGRACQDACDQLGRLGYDERKEGGMEELRAILRNVEHEIWRIKKNWYGG